jgi:hypothetical protein
MSEHGNALLATYRLDGREHTYRVSARCRTCRSPHRREIDSKLVRGEPHSAIVRALPDGCSLTAANLGEHFRRGHVAAEHEINRRLREERAEAVGREVAADTEHALTERAFAQKVAEIVFGRLASGEIRATLKEGLAAARIMAKHDLIVAERDALRDLLRTGRDEIVSVFAAADVVMDDEQWQRFGRALGGHPTLPGLLRGYERQAEAAEKEAARQERARTPPKAKRRHG